VLENKIIWKVKLKSEENLLGILLWGLGILIVAVAFIWFLQNYLGALAILVLGILYLRFYHLSPIEREVQLGSGGVKYGNDLYEFGEILFFVFLKIRNKNYVLFRTTSRNLPELVIELPQNLVKDKIEHLLSRELPRQKHINVLSPFHLDSYLGI
jgi:hypothetical protein